jgi:hypothetical protein
MMNKKCKSGLYSVLMEEKETTLRYDPIQKLWYAWSNIPKHIYAMERRGWKATHEDEYGVRLEAPEHAVRIASTQKREMTAEQKAALSERLLSNQNIAHKNVD